MAGDRGYPVAVKIVAAAVVAVAALAAGTAASGAIAPPCAGTQFKATFKVVPGSAGAGNIVYKLDVTNKSLKGCTVTGLPIVKLYGKTGKALPTHIVPIFRAGLTAILVTLAPGQSAHATARFSPDVPGTGEGNRKQCEPTAYSLHVSGRSGGVAKAPITPPTPVCEHGQLQLTAYQRGK
jgi:hypothetical protein